ALPGAAPRSIRGRDHRRRDGAAARRGQPRPSRGPPPRRAARVHARGARGAAPATRGRRRLGGARRRPWALPRAIPPRGDDESLPLRRARRSATPMLVLPRQDHRLPGEGLTGAARPLRPRRRDATAPGGGARGRPGRVVRGRTDARGRRHGTASLGGSPPDECRVPAARQRRRPAAAHGARTCPRRACGTDRGGARRLRRRAAGAPCGGALLPLPDGAREPVKVRVLRRANDAYPALLAQIPDPPRRLWLRGDAPPELLDRPAVAIVGARACSGYGRSVARLLATEAAAAGAVVVSGMARGVDGEAHRGALAAGGATVAVLGCGIDRDYPAAHAELAGAIVAAGGLVVSEYEPGVEPAPWRFPAGCCRTPSSPAFSSNRYVMETKPLVPYIRQSRPGEGEVSF